MSVETELARGTTDDDQAIIEAGYRPQLRRSLGPLSSFAVSFSSISVLLGIYANFGYVLGKAGPFGFWTWPIVGCGQLLVALVFAEMAGRLPLTGAIYNWNTRAANPFVGWLSAWMLFFSYCAGSVSVNVTLLAPLQSFLGHEFGDWSRVVGCGLILSQALFNIYGVNLAAFTNKMAVLAEIVAIIVFGLILLGIVFIHNEARIDLLTAVPQEPTPYWPSFLLSSLLAAWTILGFELSSDMSEETLNVKHIAPRSIILAVLTSTILGGFFLLVLTFAIPDLAAVTASSDPISAIMSFHLGQTATEIFLVFVLVAIYAVALIAMTATARILFAVARDGRIFGATRLSKISRHKVPATAIGLVTILEMTVFVSAKDAVDVYAATTILFFTVYFMAVASFIVGIKKLPPPHNLSLGKCRMPIAVMAALWLAAMLGILTIPEEFHRAAQIAGCIFVIGLFTGFSIRRKLKSV